MRLIKILINRIRSKLNCELERKVFNIPNINNCAKIKDVNKYQNFLVPPKKGIRSFTVRVFFSANADGEIRPEK
jgi:hypothetical protein